MQSFRRYGAGPGHFVLVAGCCALAGYAGFCAWRQGGVVFIAFWFVAGLVLHDLVGFPLYSYLDRRIQARSSGRIRSGAGISWLNHVRVPLFMSACLLVTAFPLISGLSSSSYARRAGVPASSYLVHWLEVTTGLFAVSGMVFAFRYWRSVRRPSG